jgi:hypothetical protein
MVGRNRVRGFGGLDLALRSLTGGPSQPMVEGIADNDPKMRPRRAVSFATTKQDRHSLCAHGYDRTREFLIVPSRSAPHWLLPLGNPAITARSFDIYVPYAPVGRVLKSIANGLFRSGWSGLLRNRVLVSSAGPLPIENLVQSLTGECYPVFSFSLGAPGSFRFQKVTMQVMGRDGVVLGYMKLSLTEEAKNFVRHEATVLKRLEESPLRPYIPRVLYAGPWTDVGYILFQSALNGAPGPTVLTSEHNRLLKMMREIRVVHKPGPAVLQHVAERWKRVAPQLGSRWSEIGDGILRSCARSLASVSLPCGLMHGDFTPWNSKLDNGELFLFDWEWSEEEAPLDWDLFHFKVQTASCLHKQSITHHEKYDSTPSYLLYLLYSATRLAEAGPETKPAIDYREKLAREQLAQSA